MEDRSRAAEMTLLAYGTDRLMALCNAISPRADFDPLVGAFRRLMSPWGEQRVGDRPRYRSGISDDEAPFEFSIGISDAAPEVQAYVEALGEPPEPALNMAAGRAALTLLANEVGASLDRFREIEHLFFPDVPKPPFSLWVGASWMAGREILLKAYLNPQVRGRAAAPALVGECMRRLGFAHAWEGVESALSLRRGRDEPTIVCLDLSKANPSRIKVYVRHHAATLQDVGAIARLAERYDDGDAATFYSLLAGDGGRLFSKKGPITELAFVNTAAPRPTEVSLEFPIGSYVTTDADARERVLRCLAAFDLPSAAYERAIQAVATRPLDERAGIHAHVTLRRPPANSLSDPPPAPAASPASTSFSDSSRSPRPRIAVYFASEAYMPARERA